MFARNFFLDYTKGLPYRQTLWQTIGANPKNSIIYFLPELLKKIQKNLAAGESVLQFVTELENASKKSQAIFSDLKFKPAATGRAKPFQGFARLLQIIIFSDHSHKKHNGTHAPSRIPIQKLALSDSYRVNQWNKPKKNLSENLGKDQNIENVLIFPSLPASIFN